MADNVYAEAEAIVSVVDNLNTHSTHCLYEAFPAVEARPLAKRFEWRQTPEHSSWLNIAACGLYTIAISAAVSQSAYCGYADTYQ